MRDSFGESLYFHHTIIQAHFFLFQILLPTFQVRVVRFYMILYMSSPSSPSSCSSPSPRRPLRQLCSAVDSIGPQQGAPDRSGQRRTSTGELASAVGSAGPRCQKKMPEDMSERMSEDMPERMYNVTVGIARSEVFFSFKLWGYQQFKRTNKHGPNSSTCWPGEEKRGTREGAGENGHRPWWGGGTSGGSSWVKSFYPEGGGKKNVFCHVRGCETML